MRTIAISNGSAAHLVGNEEACVSESQRLLEAAGYAVCVFPATGTGGRALEASIRQGRFAGVLDLRTAELAEELCGGIFAAGPDRLTAAAMAGVPQVIAPGGLDAVAFGEPATVPDKFSARRFHQVSSAITLMRTTPEENDRLGREIAHKASASSGPTAVMLPLRGVSSLDHEQGPFWWPQADAALFQSIHNWMSPGVRIVELDVHINDPAFAQAAAAILREMLEK